ncbi:hypothetical protein CPLU01_08222 [Colletotrichum plurivorum]|uniref:Uncharacterized protein n=1 Tax=Colletotrichum plurivorum TaxID=2175906 RepID=A0A8H6KDS4_9PEZI|nr:hypothetical protein CPLU01_08222 [Colletotrichum plurivorum]
MASDAEIEAVQAQTPHIPYEIFLLIVEAAIEDAYSQACTTPSTLNLWLEDNPSKRLCVSADGFRRAICRARFALIRSISQINHSARSAVHRRFVRFPQCDYALRIVKPEAWVLPLVDVFDFNSGFLPLRAFENATPENQRLFPHIRTLSVQSAPELRECHEEILALLEILPSVGLITTADIHRRGRRGRNRCRGQPGDTIRPAKLTTLATVEPDFERVCRTFWEMGITIHLRRHISSEPFVKDDMEVILTPEGMRLKLLAPEIDCYDRFSPKGPASDLEDDG